MSSQRRTASSLSSPMTDTDRDQCRLASDPPSRSGQPGRVPDGWGALDDFSLQGSEADYYACRLAVYTHQLALFTASLVVVTVILIGTGIYQGLHLGRAPNAAKD